MKKRGMWLQVVMTIAICILILSDVACKKEKADTREEQEEIKRSMRMTEPSSDELSLSEKVTPILHPKPTHFENQTPHTELEKIAEISANIDDEHFMVRPWHITPDDHGNIYVMDIRLKKIFKFSKTGKFISSFGETGVGPGQLGDKNTVNEIYFNPDGKLYVSDYLQQRLSCFSPDGKYITDYKIRSRDNMIISFLPKVSTEKEIFVRTGLHCSLDVYKISDNSAEFQYSLLGEEYFRKSIHFHIRQFDEPNFYSADYDKVNYNLMPNGNLMVYLHQTSELLVFKRHSLEKRFYLWPEKMLAKYLTEWQVDLKTYKNRYFTPTIFMTSFFDGDDNKFLYLSDHAPVNSPADKFKFLIYQFNENGGLNEVLISNTPSLFRCKKDGLFYGVWIDRVQIYRPKNLRSLTNEKKK